MKFRLWSLAALFFLLSHAQVFADSPKEMSGLEWLEASLGERTDCVVRSMAVLTQNGVTLTQSPNDYYNAVSETLRGHPEFYPTDVTAILAQYVYDHEQANRKAMDKLRSNVTVKKIEMH